LQARVAELSAALPRSAAGPLAPSQPAASDIIALPSHDRQPLDPSLPADHPLEPGTSPLRARATPSPAERIAASEAVLGSTKPSGEADSKSNFIAAARRAAQAAASMAVPTGGSADETKAGQSTLSKVAQKITRRRPLMIAAAILIVSGALSVVLNVLGPSGSSRVEATRKTPSEGAAPARTSSAPSKLTLPLATSQTTTTPAPGERDVSREGQGAPAAPERDAAPKREDTSSAPATTSEAATTPTVSPLTIASIKLPSGADITGSTGRTGFTLPNNVRGPRGSTNTPAADTNKLPDGFGSGLRTAATAGNPAAAYEVATRYADGRGVTPNAEEAVRWFERAADSGLAPAQYRLGSLYEKGQGIKKDPEKARSLYRSAADKGHAKAMHNLAVLYAEGIDGAPDFKVAGQWFRRAAQHNVADSQYNLGILHARGLGVEQNLAESYKWFALAAQQGDKDAAKKRDDVEARLDQQALVAAKLAVQTFVATPQAEEANAVKAPDGGWDGSTAANPPAKPKSAPRGKHRVS
jgi:localization factor PodJL